MAWSNHYLHWALEAISKHYSLIWFPDIRSLSEEVSLIFCSFLFCIMQVFWFAHWSAMTQTIFSYFFLIPNRSCHMLFRIYASRDKPHSGYHTTIFPHCCQNSLGSLAYIELPWKITGKRDVGSRIHPLLLVKSKLMSTNHSWRKQLFILQARHFRQPYLPQKVQIPLISLTGEETEPTLVFYLWLLPYHLKQEKK